MTSLWHLLVGTTHRRWVATQKEARKGTSGEDTGRLREPCGRTTPSWLPQHRGRGRGRASLLTAPATPGRPATRGWAAGPVPRLPCDGGAPPAWGRPPRRCTRGSPGLRRGFRRVGRALRRVCGRDGAGIVSGRCPAVAKCTTHDCMRVRCGPAAAHRHLPDTRNRTMGPWDPYRMPPGRASNTVVRTKKQTVSAGVAEYRGIRRCRVCLQCARRSPSRSTPAPPRHNMWGAAQQAAPPPGFPFARRSPSSPARPHPTPVHSP